MREPNIDRMHMSIVQRNGSGRRGLHKARGLHGIQRNHLVCTCTWQEDKDRDKTGGHAMGWRRGPWLMMGREVHRAIDWRKIQGHCFGKILHGKGCRMGVEREGLLWVRDNVP